MNELTRSEYVKKFNVVMNMLKDRTSFLDGNLDWSGEDLEDITQERIQDINRLVAKLNVLATTPIKEVEES